jgi:uroporphyrinogen decarboxylase
LSQYHLDAESMAAAQVAAYREYGHDLVTIGPVLGLLECLGATLQYPQDAAPHIVTPSVAGPDDLRRLRPVRVEDPRIARYLKAAKLICEQVGAWVPVALSLRCPFSTAANLRGIEPWLRDLVLRPAFAHELLDIALRETLTVIEATRAIPGLTFVATDPVASGSMVSPAHYEQFAQPYAKRLIEAMNAIGRYPTILHICGDTSRIWQAMANTHAGLLSLGDAVDLADAAAAVGDRIVLMGNVQPAGSMYLGTPETVRDDALHCLSRARGCTRGMMLSLGCDLPIDAPRENVHALLDVAREHRGHAWR